MKILMKKVRMIMIMSGRVVEPATPKIMVALLVQDGTMLGKVIITLNSNANFISVNININAFLIF